MYMICKPFRLWKHSKAGSRVLMTLCWTLLILLQWSQAAYAEAAINIKEKSVKANRIYAPPTLDGVLDDGCWKHTDTVDDFTVFSDSSRLHHEQTIVQICYDKQNIYFGFQCLVAKQNMAALVAAASDLAGRFEYGLGGVIEILLDTDDDDRTFNHFLIHLTGQSRVALPWPDRERVLLQSLNNDYIRKHTLITDNGYVVEAAIPFSILGLNSDTGKRWRLNIGRVHGMVGSGLDTDALYSSWRCTDGRGFVDPQYFGELILIEDVSRYYWHVEQATELSPKDTEIVFNIINETGQDFAGFASLRTVQSDGVLRARDKPLSLEQGRNVRVTFDYTDSDDRIELTIIDTNGLIVWRGGISRSDKGVMWGGRRKRAEAKIPEGMFKDLTTHDLGEAVIVDEKQLFIDSHIISEATGVERVLHQPVKHVKNPLLLMEKPWEGVRVGSVTVLYDEQENLYKMWYLAVGPVTPTDLRGSRWFYHYCYAVSQDGIEWDRPIINKAKNNNVIPGFDELPGFRGVVIKDSHEQDPARRYKMMYRIVDKINETDSINVAFSGDGLHWNMASENPVIPQTDGGFCPFWDSRRCRYIAGVRYGPPNTRIVSQTESIDFIHWTPKVTVLRRTLIDEPYNTQFYWMAAAPYEDIYLGLIPAYHGSTTGKIAKDEQWKDRLDTQLTFSRNGISWDRVGPGGVLPIESIRRSPTNTKDWDYWRHLAEKMVFLPYGEYKKDWDWGQVYPVCPPFIVKDDTIRIYYRARGERHYARHHNALGPNGIGLATLRLDGFVSLYAKERGVLTTRPLVFIGDTLVVNADASGGDITVEALDEAGNSVPGFSKEDCMPITTDDIDHVITWNNDPDCSMLQARVIRLRFHLAKARLYSFEPRILNKHYIPLYDEE